MITQTRDQVASFTTEASALQNQLISNTPSTSGRIAPLLDRAWGLVDYLAADGPLARSIPAQAPPETALGWLTQIAELRRIADAWKTYFEQTTAQESPQAVANDERSCLADIQRGEQEVQAKTMALTLNSSNMDAYQMQGQINELNSVLTRLWSQRPAANALLSAGRPACSQRLEALITHLESQIRMFQNSCMNKHTFEASMGWRFPYS
jgi:hypothetical protein